MKKKLKTVVRESIAGALIKLIETKKFDEISISEITAMAGVGRISFYRHFESKEAVLIDYLQVTTFPFVAEKLAIKQNTHHIFLGIFHSINQVGDVVDLLYKNNLSHIFLNYIHACCGAKPELDNQTAYHNSLIMGFVFGALDEWIRRGRVESAEEMAEKVGKLVQKIGREWDLERGI
ncbi:TetR/AcrR family transcriptional regulator [Caviibacterium pharyngocola]|uniref:TetR/AcrR family transcriptional regulator n=1 Tax=Caviibacterium pharyngocola TaxID=28159 RepID=A0A2M8RTS6_9PAST|nr:TetR/AcrR family transcriptional regulator [Caviibacterium pharyngocola]PJG82264.1 TetR/AcrR family transcriptional regulator [Caviibacterium pharyngocola]